jgi:hypothetical protein
MIKLKKPVDPATLSGQELDEYLADVRLPQLLRERADVVRRLGEMFASIKFECDWSWKPDAEADEVNVLLTGSAAPAEKSMPLPALHAHLHRRQAALDKAIIRAGQAAARVAERRLEQRLVENRPQINALARERCLLAIRLQRVNRQLLALEETLGIDRALGGLPSTGADLLGPGLPGDEVANLTDALLTIGIVSRKDILDAQH